MTNKEALKWLYHTLINFFEREEDINEIKNIYIIIKESLDKLEQFVDIYKNTNQRFTMPIQSKSSNLPNPTLEQELLRKEILENE